MALSLSPSSAGEEGGARTVTVTARVKTARSTARQITISVGKPGDRARSGTDYTAVTDFSLTLPANQTSGTATFTFTPRDDELIEGSESVTVHGTATGVKTSTSIDDINSASLTITETDSADIWVMIWDPVREGDDEKKHLLSTIDTDGGATFAHRVDCHLSNLQAGGNRGLG